ncbi:MAG: VIT1/CCC1 transporter family protein [Solirubrobacterales bacterium]|nr:VIT1/CCC1 transporter family protein [Solirubrobacterales bacterium]MBV9869824.1 VIT1/CCC1 transporter family protein [Frankiaceae bacterium]
MTDTAATKSSAEPEIHHTHRDVVGGRLRPAVFGAMDGVISNGALIAGVAGAHTSAHDVILTGLAGLLAGAFSMAVGEWTSVRSQSLLVKAEIAKERAEIKRAPRAEERELAAIFRHRGLSRELATRVAREISEDPDEAWRTHVREELGVDPDEQPSPYVAAGSSFVTFGIGALVPVLPYLLGAHHVWISLVLIGIALLAIGTAVAKFTDRAAVSGALQHLMLGGVTVAVVYGVGSAIGTGVTG